MPHFLENRSLQKQTSRCRRLLQVEIQKIRASVEEFPGEYYLKYQIKSAGTQPRPSMS